MESQTPRRQYITVVAYGTVVVASVGLSVYLLLDLWAML